MIRKKAESLSDLQGIADWVCTHIKNPKVWLFFGEMGVGKTTFIKALASACGVADDVSSPTFGLMNEYRDGSNRPIYHFDFYRIHDEEEAIDMGWEEFRDSECLCWVEWPSQIESLWPESFLKITIECEENGVRMITFE